MCCSMEHRILYPNPLQQLSVACMRGCGIIVDQGARNILRHACLVIKAVIPTTTLHKRVRFRAGSYSTLAEVAAYLVLVV
jgi:hypothetical protein